jgi:hypothetical protein
MLTSKAVISLERPEGAMLLNLPLFPSGFTSAFDRIPDQKGVYAFFPYMDFPEEPEALFEAIITNVERKKFADRQTSLAPYYGITLESKTSLSGAKLPKLRNALHNKHFRKDLIETLGNSLLFQSPLYLGKSKNLRSRISQHLAHSSELRERLSIAGYSIENTTILIIPSTEAPHEEPDLDDDIDADGLAEEVLSRLFHIQFTLRLG